MLLIALALASFAFSRPPSDPHLPIGPNLITEPGDWPQWRGAEGDGLSHGVAWSAEGTTKWTAEIGLGYSAASVSGERVYAFGFDAERSLDVLRALELESGKELWKREWRGELRANQHEGGTLSTPAVAGERVFVSTSSGTVYCHRVSDGEVVWMKDLAQELGVDPGYYGFAGSPLVLDGRVYVDYDRALALDAGTGELEWKSEPLQALYATPARFELAGQPCVAVFGQTGLSVLARASGAALSFFPWHKGDRLVNAATPVVVGQQLFVSSGYEHGCALIEPAAGAAKTVWENRVMRNKMAGCVLADGALYGFDESMLKCLDLAGNERWHVRGLGSGAISGGDGKLAILSSSGELIVARTNDKEFTELARATLFDAGVCWTPPTIASGRILCRNNRGTLVCRDHRGGAHAAGNERSVAEVGAHAKPAASELPAAEKLLDAHLKAIGGADVLQKHPALRIHGTYEQRSVGYVPVPYSIESAAPAQRRVEIQFPPPLDEMFTKDGVKGHLARVCDGTNVFELNTYRGDKLYAAGEEREELAAAHLAAAAEWRTLYATVRTVARVDFDERPCYRVEATTRDGRTRTLYFELTSGLCAGRESADEGLVSYRDYKAFDGWLLPTKERVFRPDGGIEETFRVESVEFVAPEELDFAASEAVTKLLAERAQPAEKR